MKTSISAAASLAKHFLSSSLLVSLSLFAVHKSYAQSVGIGTTSPNNSAQLDVSASDRGLLIPRLNAAQRGSILSPATSLLIYQTDGVPGIYINMGTLNSPVWALLQTGVIGVDNGGTAP